MQQISISILLILQQQRIAGNSTTSGGSAARTTTATTFFALSLMAENTIAPHAAAVVSLRRSAFIKKSKYTNSTDRYSVKTETGQICYREYFKMKG